MSERKGKVSAYGLHCCSQPPIGIGEALSWEQEAESAPYRTRQGRVWTGKWRSPHKWCSAGIFKMINNKEINTICTAPLNYNCLKTHINRKVYTVNKFFNWAIIETGFLLLNLKMRFVWWMYRESTVGLQSFWKLLLVCRGRMWTRRWCELDGCDCGEMAEEEHHCGFEDHASSVQGKRLCPLLIG